MTDYQEQIEIRFLNRDFLKDIQKAAFNTIGRRDIPDREMSPALLKNYLISEHSPIRTAQMEILFRDIAYPTSVHFARHVHSIPFVTTSREDRTGQPRSLEKRVDHLAVWNLQALIEMMRKRLCRGSCAPDTYAWARSLKLKLMDDADLYLKAIGDVLVPNCVYRMGCPEFKKCHLWKGPLTGLSSVEAYSIKERYDRFNTHFLERAT